jgi:hypothetical protein
MRAIGYRGGMRPSDRWLIAIALVLIDLFIFVLPLTSLFAAWVLIGRPTWFKRWVDELYSS